MFRNRKGFNAAQLRTTSTHLRTATYGTHIPRRDRSTHHMNADSVGFSNGRKKKRAARGIVDTILPTTATRESSSEYSHRIGRREYSQEVQRRMRFRRIVIIVACVLLVVAVAVGAGSIAFVGSVDAKMALNDSDAKAALVAPSQKDQPFYTLVAADLDIAEDATTNVAGPDALVLVRIDEGRRAVSLISIPPNLGVSLSDGETHQIREAATLDGDAALLSAVADFASVDIAHYVKLDAPGIEALVDGMGGVEVDVSQEVDDPTAGDVYLSAGVQTLDGDAALTFLRAGNFENGLETQAADQRALLAAASVRLIGDGAIDFLSRLDSLGGDFKTDMSVTDALSLADGMRGIDSSDVTGALVPGYGVTRDDVDYYVASSDSWTGMMQRMDAGESPAPPVSDIPEVDHGSFTITVRNGAAITGGASQMAGLLKDDGFDVVDIGNTDAAVYPETLVVYKDDGFEAAAQTVVEALDTGRTVKSSGFYTFDTDVLVVLGKDWTPVA